MCPALKACFHGVYSLASVRIPSWSLLVMGMLVLMALGTGAAWSQAPYPMQAPQAPEGPPPQAGPPGAPQEQQRPLEYAFRPDLTNPEYGECLQLEKSWQALWQSYAQAYQTIMSMSPQHPQYQQMAAYVNNLKSRLDTAWNTFSSKCVYFPPRR
jgi:hypothetical protein